MSLVPLVNICNKGLADNVGSSGSGNSNKCCISQPQILYLELEQFLLSGKPMQTVQPHRTNIPVTNSLAYGFAASK